MAKKLRIENCSQCGNKYYLGGYTLYCELLGKEKPLPREGIHTDCPLEDWEEFFMKQITERI